MTSRIVFIIASFLLSAYSANAQSVVHENEDTTLVMLPDQMPIFPGDFYEFLGQSVQYPYSARKNKITGKVVASFTVEKDGTVSNIEIISKEIGYGLEEEVKRVLSAMPRWKPGVNNGELVRVRMTVPIKFGL